MKTLKYFLALIFSMMCSVVYAQQKNDSTYVSNNGTTFKVGQKVTLGLGSGTDGHYKYIVSINVFGLPEKDNKLDPNYATRSVTITKIKHIKASLFSKESTPYLFFKVDNAMTPYGINIEPALLAKEIVVN